MYKIICVLIVVFFGLNLRLNAQEKNKDLHFIADSLIEMGIQNKAFPGAQLLIYKKDSVQLLKSYGYHTYDSIVKVKNTDLYDLASVTKILAGTLAFMKLYELYDIDLNERVSEYLPYLKRSNKKKSSFKQVLSHSSGWIPYIAHQNFVRKKNGKFKPRTLKTNQTKRYSTQISDSLFVFKNYPKKIIQRIRKTEIKTVGEYLYSGLWFFLVPELTKQLSGLSFESFLKLHFYNPLQLQRLSFLPTRYFPKSEIVPTEYDNLFRKQLVQGWVHDEAAALMGGINGNAGLFANASSIAPLLELLLNKGSYNGKLLLKPETVKLFTQRAYPESTNRRGLGFDKPSVSENQDAYPSNLASPSSFGHSGFTGTFVWVDPSEDCFIIFLSNRVYPSREQRALYELGIRGKLLDYALQN
jgi:CubicO group peptidase (beta-lactamase class C family)